MDKKACIFDEHWTTVEIKPPRWEVDLGSHVERSEDHSEVLFQPTKVLGFWQVYHINLKDALVLPHVSKHELQPSSLRPQVAIKNCQSLGACSSAMGDPSMILLFPSEALSVL